MSNKNGTVIVFDEFTTQRFKVLKVAGVEPLKEIAEVINRAYEAFLKDCERQEEVDKLNDEEKRQQYIEDIKLETQKWNQMVDRLFG